MRIRLAVRKKIEHLSKPRRPRWRHRTRRSCRRPCGAGAPSESRRALRSARRRAAGKRPTRTTCSRWQAARSRGKRPTVIIHRVLLLNQLVRRGGKRDVVERTLSSATRRLAFVIATHTSRPWVTHVSRSVTPHRRRVGEDAPVKTAVVLNLVKGGGEKKGGGGWRRRMSWKTRHCRAFVANGRGHAPRCAARDP